MDYEYIFLVAVLSHLWYHTNGVPLITGIFKGIFSDDTETVEVETNELPVIQDPDVIDLSIYGHSLYGNPDFNKTGNLVADFQFNKSSVNPEELGSYLEGDILIPYNAVKLKNGLSSKAYRWPNGEIPFEISRDFTEEELNLIASAMNQYHNKTCIRFTHRTNQIDHVLITGQDTGCWSAVGRLGGKQQVNLQTSGCLAKPGTVIHELMHVLGFMHEQNRKERDSFVDIKLENVQKYAVDNFQMHPDTVSFGVGYDYGSVMHYSPVAFSSNGQPTIVAKNRLGEQLMGQRDGFSSLDIKKINAMYNCKINSESMEPPIKLTNL